MSNLFVRIVATSCPVCGQEAPKVVRRHRVGSSPPTTEQLTEPCMACLLALEKQPGRDYLVRQWRALWQSAGGKIEELPDCLRQPADPPRPAPAPAVPHVVPPRPADGRRPGWNTPSWKQEARLIPPAPPPRRRPRVLFVSHDFSPSGAPRVLLNVLPHLRGMQAEVHALADGPLAAAFAAQGYPPTGEFRPDRYDLIVCNTLASAGAVEAAQQAGIPAVWLVHEWGPHPFVEPARFVALANYCRKVVYAHEAQAAQFPTLPAGKSAVIASVIPPTAPLPRDQARRDLGIDPAAFVVLGFGMDEPRKGQADVRAAAAGLDVELYLIAGSDTPRLWLSAADLYVSTSRAECYPLSLQEAKACRLPVIATDLPVHAEMIQSGVNGYLYEPGDVEELQTLLRRVRDNADLRGRIAAAPINAPSWEDSLSAYERLILREAGGGIATTDELHVVYHVAGMGEHWRDVVDEQMRQLSAAGLHRLLVTHCGEGADWVCEHGRELGLEVVLCSHADQLTVYERPAIELIEHLAANSDKPVFYLHSKAVSHPLNDNTYHEWRRLMMDELVPYWRQHVLALEEHDAVGVNWWNTPEKWHFSGNFWFARASWLRGLPRIATRWRDRYTCERWIGFLPGCKAKSLLCSDAAFWDKDRHLLHQLRNIQIARHKESKHE